MPSIIVDYDAALKRYSITYRGMTAVRHSYLMAKEHIEDCMKDVEERKP